MVATDVTDDTLLSTDEVAPVEAKPVEAPPVSKCPECAVSYSGGFRQARLGAHMKREHPEAWAKRQAAKVGAVPAKRAPRKRVPSAATPAAKPKRRSAADLFGRVIDALSTVIVRIDQPTGSALAFTAPAAGAALDDLAAGTFVDKRLIQPATAAADKWEKVSAVVGLPILVALMSRRPQLRPALEGPLREAVVDVLIARQPIARKRAEREHRAAEAIAALGELDPEIAAAEDPIGLIVQSFFGPASSDGDATTK